MRIAYLSQMADISTENGITKKIRSQCVAWQAAGHSVRYFALAPTLAVWPGLAPLETELVARGSLVTRFFKAPNLARAINDWKPDIIYYRYGHHVTGLPRLFENIPTIAEINSDDLNEYVLSFPLVKRIYHHLTRAWVLSRVAGFIPVTRELGARFSSFGRPALPIGNSVELAAFPHLSPSLAPPRLVFLGSPGGHWHGMERIAQLATLLPSIHFDVIGLDSAAWGQQAKIAPASNVTLHGLLPRDRYAALLANCTAALGSFALYKNKMQEACPLKVREYLAVGLPVIAAYEDTDIPPHADYFLRLPNDDSPLAPHLPRILDFLKHWQHRRVPRVVVAHLDTSVKERERLAFMEEIRQSFTPGRNV
jgi:glycosyltransferase involved in cell wall biosynthesis